MTMEKMIEEGEYDDIERYLAEMWAFISAS